MSPRNSAERIKLLSGVDVLEALGTEEMSWLAQRILERDFRSGDIVYVPGDATEVVFLLLTGRVRLYGMSGERELTFEVILGGSMFGIASLAERTQAEYAQALEPSRVGLLGLQDFWRLVGRNPEVNARVIGVLGERLRRNRSRMKDIALKEVPARLASLILDLVEGEGIVTREGHYAIQTTYTHEQIAAMIGAKRVAVTKAFRNLQEAGCLRRSRRQIYVVDLATLQRCALALNAPSNFREDPFSAAHE
jgi:CRP/FNR family transcriptional regulator, cyclic AMP receptor protein